MRNVVERAERPTVPGGRSARAGAASSVRAAALAIIIATGTSTGSAQGLKPPPVNMPRPNPVGAPPTGVTLSTAAPSVIPLDWVVAVVGDQPITFSEVVERINTMRASGQSIPTDSAELTAFEKDIVGRMVDEELLVQQAKLQKVDVDDKEIAASVDQRIGQIRSKFGSDQEYKAELKKAGFGSPEEYRRYVLDQQRRELQQQRLFQKLKDDGKLPLAPVSEKDVTQYFEENKEKVPRVPATVTFRQIVVATKPTPAADSAAFVKAESLYAEVKKFNNFEQVAKRESMDPDSKAEGGDLGWLRRGTTVPEFDRVIFSIPPGVVTPPFHSTYGYHIVKVDRAEPAEVKVRQILIRPQVDSVDVERARAEAEQVAEQWRAGVSYDSLVAKHHDAAEVTSNPEPFPRAELPQSYQTAFDGRKAEEIIPPFRIEDSRRQISKFVVSQLTTVKDEHAASIADFREQIRSQLAQEGAIRRYLDQLRKQTYVAVKL